MLETICSKCGEIYNPEFLGQIHFVSFETGKQCYGVPLIGSEIEYKMEVK